MPGFEVFGEEEKQQALEVFDTGVLFRYEFGEQRKSVYKVREFEQAFLRGYTQVRSLAESEKATIPVFKAVRAVFSIGVPAMNVNHWGRAYLYAFLDLELDRLKECMEKV